MRRRATVPARVNIIGEHTDYAGGLSLPFAIDKYLTLDAVERKEGYSGDSTVIELWKAAGGWPADLQVSSSIPPGKGLSSSAALCVAVILCATGSNDCLAVSKEAQRIEQEVLKTPCGLLDQMAMMYAKEGYATLIDFSTESIKHITIPDTWVFKLVDSGIHRDLSTTSYNSENLILGNHVLEENTRVESALEASGEELGVLLNQSHESLRKIGVSLPEVDELVNSLQTTAGVLGARMMGGGFGGMILVLVKSAEILPEVPAVGLSGPALLEEIL